MTISSLPLADNPPADERADVSSHPSPDGGRRRRAARPAVLAAAYALLIVIAAAQTAGRLLAAPPFMGPNDNSRWATARALLETGSYAIGRQEVNPRTGDVVETGIVSQPDWSTVDRVLMPGTGVFYSTKPPLLPTIIAGEGWLLRKTLDWRLRRDRPLVARTVLLTLNWAPFVLSLVLLSRMLDDLAETMWARLLVLATAAFGTFVTTFLVTLNNHTVAAAGALFAFYHVHRLRRGDGTWWRAAAAGGLAGWTACNELPALLLLVVLLGLTWQASPRLALRAYLPAALMPIALSLALNVVAFGDIVPAYARPEWYHYAGSYWDTPVGFDAANESNWVYAVHLLLGHEGIFSLAPVFLLSLVGTVRALRERLNPERRLYAAVSALLTVVTVGFYVFKTTNYGGTTAVPRWFIWLTPFWLVTIVPAADRWAASPRARAVAYALLAISVASVHYAAGNPWQPSWLYYVLRSFGLVSYD